MEGLWDGWGMRLTYWLKSPQSPLCTVCALAGGGTEREGSRFIWIPIAKRKKKKNLVSLSCLLALFLFHGCVCDRGGRDETRAVGSPHSAPLTLSSHFPDQRRVINRWHGNTCYLFPTLPLLALALRLVPGSSINVRIRSAVPHLCPPPASHHLPNHRTISCLTLLSFHQSVIRILLYSFLTLIISSDSHQSALAWSKITISSSSDWNNLGPGHTSAVFFRQKAVKKLSKKCFNAR